jgi:hypothetical protein
MTVFLETILFWSTYSSSVCSMSSSVATVGGKKSPRMILNPGFIDLLHL